MEQETIKVSIGYLKEEMAAAGVSLRKLSAAAGVPPMTVSHLLNSGRDTAKILPLLQETLNSLVEERTSSYAAILRAEDKSTSSSRAPEFSCRVVTSIVEKCNAVDKLCGMEVK